MKGGICSIKQCGLKTPTRVNSNSPDYMFKTLMIPIH